MICTTNGGMKFAQTDISCTDGRQGTTQVLLRVGICALAVESMCLVSDAPFTFEIFFHRIWQTKEVSWNQD
ncbi:uncharacterized protein CANTADRAFT_225622 [Suhomyces tanzawaensis NRRL Y-17324]|uniref:Uncharacterized protein n=1 Tax=Suhomyces tanzawaensis NRRL Y-17324 TaxID=984487 RepID=A0A1E4SKK9_9ASCO|nr:uncharacterized protein CANTADRAFT_225622 [Suhomyces tanzawaensis NRRL Y-17324]ODV80041.1 hypothetical protein CANTADRAFT_225622 [Suhomyces tanzawaensis NRRL Y-17324]